ncbi:hypothetical protein J2S98_004039 [Arthrobacter oryzae]|uniref:DUF4192 domain-containing protein n=1 Tax=Pseudarthrobacter enclensis TaxID=993070 RepID=A0ABT9RXS3_9MICC|nr:MULTISPECIES: DUF4192 domain-containing protein [Micrococcaceae]MDP9890042.1 hypothetical protein [Pseudarthrobacter enclensis]MDP9988850.1 hypothetical protein [Arthrobacter oryzae]
MNDHITVSTAADMLAYFPHSLGFEPRESFGFISLQGAKVNASLRMDIPDESVNPTDYAQTVTHYLLSDEGATGFLMLVYTNEPAADPAPGAKPYSDYAKAISTEAEKAGLSLRGGWLITDAGWTTYFCEDPACCRMQPLSSIRDSAVNAELVYRGSVKRADRATVPAFTGSESTHADIWETAARYPMIDGLDFDHPDMREARRAWHEALGTTPEEPEAVELLAALQCKPIRDRIFADAICPTEDPTTYMQVMIGRFEGRPDWSRVEATEDLLMHLLTFAPSDTRTPVFCFLGWLRWYKGQSSLAAAYIAQGLEEDPTHRLALLLMQLLKLGTVPEAAKKPSTSYPASFNRR